MIKLALTDKKERALLFSEAARISGIAEAIIEKDFWVCFMLEHLFVKSVFKDDILFKGGTSLSKCYGVIQRFSEDIDIVLNWKVLGYDDDISSIKRSNTAQEKMNHEINQKTTEFLKERFIPQIKDDMKNLKLNDYKIEMDEIDPLSVLFTYPSIYRNSYVLPSVKIEIGALAARIPVEEKLVTPYIENYLVTAVNGYGFNVKVVSAVRTLFEKMTILHSEANRVINHPARYARHYYDTYMMSVTKILDEALNQTELLEDVVKFNMKYYHSSRSKYEDILVGKLKLVPNADAIDAFKADYKQMHQMFFGVIPDFDEIISKLKEVEEVVNQTVINVVRSV